MEIKDLQAKQGNVTIELDIISKKEPREFEKFGKTGKVCNAQARDAVGGTIEITLWNEQADQINVGDKVKITNGYVNEWNDNLQLTTGKFGTLEVIGKSESNDDSTEDNRGEIPAVDVDVSEEKVE